MSLIAGARGFVLALLILFAPAAALAAPKFPPLTGRVVDDANLLSPQAEQKLTDELAALEQKTGHQLVVATLPDLQGYEIEDYGYQLLRTWGIGRKGEDDGIILIVAPSQKKVRIEVGYGLEPVMTDALSSLIIQRKILPAFKEGHFEQGVVDGAGAIAAQIGLPEDEAKAAAAQAIQVSAPQGESGGGLSPVLIFGLFIGFWILSGVLGAFRGRRYGRRGGGGGLWWLLPLILSSSNRGGGGGWGGGGGGWSGGGGGGFSGGGGSGGGGGASGSW